MNIGNIDMNGGYLGSEEVIKCYQGNTVVWEQSSGSPIDYSTMPLTFEILSDGNINWKNSGGNAKTIQYSKNDGAWTSIRATASISVVSGDIIQFKGDNKQYSNNVYYNWFTTTVQFNVKGNIMSLIDSTNFSALTSLSATYALQYLFQSCTGLIDASNLILPATTLTNYCYYSMFYECTSLTTAPVLPATTLANSCYEYMFTGCSHLNYIKCLATNISATRCTYGWVNGVQTTSGTFVTPSTTTWGSGNSGIPTNWTRVNSDE